MRIRRLLDIARILKRRKALRREAKLMAAGSFYARQTVTWATLTRSSTYCVGVDVGGVPCIVTKS